MASQRAFYIALGVVIVGGAGFIALRASNGGANVVVYIPANVSVTAADTSGFRGYIIGASTAPLEVTEYGDLECPGCAQWELLNFQDVKLRLIDAGKIRFRYRDYPWDDLHMHPRVAAHALACANDQGHAWDVMPRMFETQTDWARAANPIPALADLLKGVGGNVDTWATCMKSAKYAGRIQASLNEGIALGVKSTPSFLIGGQIYPGISSATMVHLVDSLIGAMPKPATN
jgi:protein-disulfide isomerase